MIIRNMKASFGRLNGASLTPGPGLNIIYAPNEGGKSTWSAFLRNMFYGIDTKERDSKTALAEKNRWQPWSGLPMEGELRLFRAGREIVLRRFGKGAHPFGGFSALDAGSGEEPPDLAGGNAGEVLLGISRGVYERSAFIGQGAVSVSGEPELEKRIAALVSSGEETISYTQADGRLREWLRRRKFNKTGWIPALEEELSALSAALERLEGARRRADAAGTAMERLQPELKRLEAESELHRRIAQQELDRQYAEAQKVLRAAREREEALLKQAEERKREEGVSDPQFPGMTAEEAWSRANLDALAVTGYRKSGFLALSLWTLLGIAVSAVLFFLWRRGVVGQALLCALGLLPMAAGVWLAAGYNRSARDILKRYGVSNPADILNAAAVYRDNCARREEAQKLMGETLSAAQIQRESARKLADALAGSGARMPASEILTAPPRTRPETEARLSGARSEYTRLSGDLAMAKGELNTLGDPAALFARREELRAQLMRRKREYDALTLALEELAQANSELQARFSPRLNKRSGELMQRLTGGKYSSVALTRDFQAMAGEADQVLPRRAITLSQGTADQLYLAVRLAVCELVLPSEEPIPLMLDDALANFDDGRMALALELLYELSKKRQILLFTCHRREGEYLSGRRDVSFLDLQS